MIGKCFVRGNDLTFDPDDYWQSFRYEVCNPNYDMEMEGMCNMGISGGMTETDVYIGATGSYLWQGEDLKVDILKETAAFPEQDDHQVCERITGIFSLCCLIMFFVIE